jgi:spermidine/putrescine transport system substrate-binding protein
MSDREHRQKPLQRRSPLTRRQFLSRAAVAGVAAPSLAALLDGCASSSVIGPGAGPVPSGSGSATTGGLVIASPDNPVTWPISPDNPPIDDGLQPEQGGVLQLYNYADYLAPSLIKAFKAKYADYDVDVQLSTFNDTEEAITKIRSGDIPYDIYFPSYDQISKMVAGDIIRPLAHSYIPNIKNCWPSFMNPWYDGEWRYTVPYTVYTTGMGWNTDLVPDDISALSNPYASLWDSKYGGKTAIIDDYHTAMSMVLLKNGITDINTSDPANIALMGTQLSDLSQATGPKVTITMYNDLPLGQLGLCQMWSGDIVNAVYYLPKGKSPDILHYWFPDDGKGMVDNDLMVVLKGGKCPVLAHLFLDFMLDEKNSIKNFGYTGYQPPQNSINPKLLVQQGLIPANLKSATVLPEYFDVGYRLLELPPAVMAQWQQVWQKFKAGG